MTDFARCTGTTAKICQYCRRREQGDWPNKPHILHQPEENDWCSLYIEPLSIFVSNNTGANASDANAKTRIY